MTYTSEITLFDVVTKTTSSLEIVGTNASKCVFRSKTLENSVHYNDEMVRRMLEYGLTRSEISESEKNAGQQAALAIGDEKTCQFSTTDLSAMLERWKAGSYSSKDLSFCGGAKESNIPSIADEINAELPPEMQSPPAILPVEQAETPAVLEEQPENRLPLAQEPAPSQSEPISPQEQEQETTFSFIRQFSSSEVYSPSVFCANRNNGTFISTHYKEYWGGECVSEKGKEGTINASEFPSKCERIPCCLDGPLKEYSKRYDYFECGYR